MIILLGVHAYPLRYSCASERVWGGLHCGIRSHRFGVNDSRNQLTSSYHAHNYWNNPVEMGSHRTVRMEGRVLVATHGEMGSHGEILPRAQAKFEHLKAPR
jgi:hypothetical protein